jgi:hypothetical protein
MKNISGTNTTNSNNNISRQKNLGLVCINYSLSHIQSQSINYLPDFRTFTNQNYETPLITQNNDSLLTKKYVQFHKKTNYNTNAFTETGFPLPSDMTPNSFDMTIDNLISELMRCIKSGQFLNNKVHIKRVERLSLFFKKNLQDETKVKKILSKLSDVLHENEESIKVI